MNEDPYEAEVTPATLDQIRALIAGKSTFAVMATRPGVLGWMTQVEYTWFKPQTEANYNFELITMTWPDDFPLHWILVTVPLDYEERVLGLLWQHGLKAQAGLTHMIIGPRGPEQFPLQGKHIFPLENHSRGAKNVAYTNDPKRLKQAREHEMYQIGRIYQDYWTWFKSPEGQAETAVYWEKRGVTPPPIEGWPPDGLPDWWKEEKP